MFRKIIHPFPRIDEIFASLEGGKLFIKLKISNAHIQLALDDESQLLSTWRSYIELLTIRRLPSGVKTAAAV